jgi:creatinine amidohydrolase
VNGVLLGEMTSEESGKAIRNSDFVLLPTGSIEQHSLHLPLLTDSIRAENISRRLAESSKSVKIVVLPTLCYGYSEHHIHYPGTITLTPTTFQAILFEIASSLKKHGAKRLLVLNFHGGNAEPIKIVADAIQRNLGLKVYASSWTSLARDLIIDWAKSEDWGHACEHETSMILYFRPDLVRKEKIRKPNMPPKPVIRQIAYWEERTDTGGIGDPTKADAGFAEQLVEKVNTKIVAALEMDMKNEPSPPHKGQA